MSASERWQSYSETVERAQQPESTSSSTARRAPSSLSCESRSVRSWRSATSAFSAAHRGRTAHGTPKSSRERSDAFAPMCRSALRRQYSAASERSGSRRTRSLVSRLANAGGCLLSSGPHPPGIARPQTSLRPDRRRAPRCCSGSASSFAPAALSATIPSRSTSTAKLELVEVGMFEWVQSALVHAA
eukprot:3626106-Prymnesium_polylepis.1